MKIKHNKKLSASILLSMSLISSISNNNKVTNAVYCSYANKLLDRINLINLKTEVNKLEDNRENLYNAYNQLLNQ